MIRTAILVAAKDLRIEVRSRVLLWQVVPFGVMALLLIGLAVGPSATTTRHVAPGLFYVVSVSYTHLDVYKRQDSSTGLPNPSQVEGITTKSLAA